MTRPSKFAPEFKARAIDLYRSSEGRTIADVARELGIGTETFRKWVGYRARYVGGDDQVVARVAAWMRFPRPAHGQAGRLATTLGLGPATRLGGLRS